MFKKGFEKIKNIRKVLKEEIDDYKKMKENMERVKERDEEIKQLHKEIFDKAEKLGVSEVTIWDNPEGEKEKIVFNYLVEMKNSSDAWHNRWKYLDRLKEISKELDDLL